jgi:hypothetical protein
MILNAIKKVALAITPASVAAASVSTQTFSTAYVGSGSFVAGIIPPADPGVGVSAFGVSEGNITLVFSNPTATAIVPAAGTWEFLILE